MKFRSVAIASAVSFVLLGLVACGGAQSRFGSHLARGEEGVP